MIKVENINVYNTLEAINGIRNAMKSWDKSDSDMSKIGPKDLKLALKLAKAGPDHRKFMRQIFVSMNITAPLYWWKEMDTYKIGTTTNSESTMHTLTKRHLTEDDFSWDPIAPSYATVTPYRHEVLKHLNQLIEWINAFDNTKKQFKTEGETEARKELWRELIQDLPSSFNQMRTWTANYEVLRNIYHARKYHKLKEWREFCSIIETLPHSELITKEED